MKSLRISFVALLLVTGTAFAVTGPERLSDARLEARAVALQKSLRCVVCQGESLDESNAALAADLRRLIREMIAKGQSDTQIENYLVARYGDFILMKPPLKQETFLLWFGPLIVLAIGTAAGGAVIMRARRNLRAESPDETDKLVA
jgi:cytochrome c-type biogenesis protein CcmH